ncbi:MAG: bifunctional enoyl-CoA hydratase/phosphate acetyltransferase [Pseudomonadota bacterium]
MSDHAEHSAPRHRHFAALLERAKGMDPMPTTVIAPEETSSLGGALLARAHGLLEPILVGDPAKIHAAAETLGADLTGLEIVPEPDHKAAALIAVRMVREGRASVVMKGHLHTDALLRAVLNKEVGLRTQRRLSHVFAIDVPGFDRLLMVTDGAINIAPDLKTKTDIAQSAIHLAHALGIETPCLAALAAVETVNPVMQPTVDAQALTEMAASGAITGGLVDGPLAMDNAIDLRAAEIKGIVSEVAGRADILLVPDIEAGNMVTKALTFAAAAQTGGLVLGAAAPVILTSRADDDQARLASAVLAVLDAAWRARLPKV